MKEISHKRNLGLGILLGLVRLVFHRCGGSVAGFQPLGFGARPVTRSRLMKSVPRLLDHISQLAASRESRRSADGSAIENFSSLTYCITGF
jgi:hypothetical protein